MKNPLQPLFESIAHGWAGLSLRERRMLALMFAAFVVTVGALVFGSIQKDISARKSRIAEKEMQIQKVALLAAGYREAEVERSRIEARIRGTPVRLFSYLEDISKRQNLGIGDMQDRGTDPAGDGIHRSTVEVSFASIDLESLTNFLNEIEKNPRLVKVEKLRIRHRNDDPNLLDANLTVSTYQLTQS